MSENCPICLVVVDEECMSSNCTCTAKYHLDCLKLANEWGYKCTICNKRIEPNLSTEDRNQTNEVIKLLNSSIESTHIIIQANATTFRNDPRPNPYLVMSIMLIGGIAIMISVVILLMKPRVIMNTTST